VLTFLLLVRREVDQPLLRAVGWAISVLGLTTLAALAIPNWTPGPVVGAGGYIGAMGRGLLETHFAQAGAYIFALSVLLAGLLLSTDYFLFRAAAVTTSVTGRSLLQVGHFGHVTAKKKTNRVKSDVEDEVELDDDEADDDDEELEEDEEESDEIEDGDQLDETNRDIGFAPRRPRRAGASHATPPRRPPSSPTAEPPWHHQSPPAATAGRPQD
jgi:hypothetical protein